MKLTWRFDSELSRSKVAHALGDLLAKEGVEARSEGNSLRSTSIAQPILGFDPRLYSRRNPVGLNPFVFFDRVTFDFDTNGRTQVSMNLGLKRAVIWATVAAIFLVAVGIRASVGIALGLAALTAIGATVLLCVAFAMVKLEVRDCLREATKRSSG
jgi:hypothetical protein